MTDQLTAIAERLHATPQAARSADALCDQVVVPALREAIINNLLPPGHRLAEVNLSQRLKVSRTPLREAFAQLEREGLVTVVPRVGVFVREISQRDIEEIYEVRSALESLAVELATKRMSAVGRAQLDELVQAMQARVAANDPAGYTDALDSFYAAIMALADNTTLYQTHTSLLGPVRRLRHMAMSLPGRMQASCEQAIRIKQAMQNGDPNGPQLMREQLANACHAAQAALEQHK